MPTANPIATFSTVTKTTTIPTVAAVKQETGPGTFAPKSASLVHVTAPTTATLSTTITPSPIAAPSTIQDLHVHVPTPVTLQSIVHVPKATAVPQPIPVTTHSSHSYPAQNLCQPQPAGKIMTRTINRVAAPSVQTPAALPAPRPKTSSPSAKPSKKKKAAICMATAQAAASSLSAAPGENTGRWTAEEHRLFLQGLEQHGKGWKKIASLIKSRTVVQIRTHAQKYFQKIAKARQNGEEGEVSMENRERVIVSNNSKRKRGGNKRKAISSVVASAAKEGKKQATDKSKKMVGGADTVVPFPMVAPSLTPYVYPLVDQGGEGDGIVTPPESTVPSITTAHGTISGAALEDSLFRFLTPMPNDVPEGSGQVNDVARQAGANPITLPSGSKATHPQFDGEVSPTGVVDFPSDWAWNSEPPAWYAKGADVDELLNEADALDWLADSGDLHETYNPPDHSRMSEPSLMSLVESDNSDPIKVEPASVSTTPVPIIDETTPMTPCASSGNMPPLPSMFDSGNDLPEMKKEQSVSFSSSSLFASATEAADAVEESEHFKLLDEQFDEQAFVTALLDQTGDSASHLNHIHMDQ